MKLRQNSVGQSSAKSNITNAVLGGPKVDPRGLTLDEARMEDLRRIYRETESTIRVNQAREGWLLGIAVVPWLVWVFGSCLAGVWYPERMPAFGTWLLGTTAAAPAAFCWLNTQIKNLDKEINELEESLANLERRTALSPISLPSQTARHRHRDPHRSRDRSRKRLH